MSDSVTARFGLPLLASGQAEKELTHNEALVLIDSAISSAVVDVGIEVPPVAPEEGQCWLIGAAPTGAWAGKPQALASWTLGGWRFVQPRDGAEAWSISDAKPMRYLNGQWTIGELRGARLLVNGVKVVDDRAGAIVDPAGGSTIDSEARGTLTAILAALRHHGLIAS